MELANSLRQGVKKVVQHYETGIWLDDLGVAWSNVHNVQPGHLPTVLLKAGFQDYLALVKTCAFCQLVLQPEYPQRYIVRYADPGPRVEQMARQLRVDACSRYEYVSVSTIVSEICQRFKVATFDWFGMDVASIPCLQQLMDLEAKVYNFTSAFVSLR